MRLALLASATGDARLPLLLSPERPVAIACGALLLAYRSPPSASPLCIPPQSKGPNYHRELT